MLDEIPNVYSILMKLTLPAIEKLGNLEEHIYTKFDQLEERIDKKFDQLGKKFDNLYKSLEGFERSVDNYISKLSGIVKGVMIRREVEKE